MRPCHAVLSAACPLPAVWWCCAVCVSLSTCQSVNLSLSLSHMISCLSVDPFVLISMAKRQQQQQQQQQQRKEQVPVDLGKGSHHRRGNPAPHDHTIHACGYELRVFSVAGVATTVRVTQPERKFSLLFDLGILPLWATNIQHVFISHCHTDHVGSLISHCRASSLGGKAPTYYVPAHATELLQDLKEGFDTLDGKSGDDSPPPLKIVPVQPGQAIMVKGFKILPFATHHRVPSLGYLVYRQVPPTVPMEYRHLAPRAIAELRQQGAFGEPQWIPDLCYMGDCIIDSLAVEPDIARARLLLCEATYLSPELCSYLETAQHERVVLMHFSRRSVPRRQAPFWCLCNPPVLKPAVALEAHFILPLTGMDSTRLFDFYSANYPQSGSRQRQDMAPYLQGMTPHRPSCLIAPGSNSKETCVTFAASRSLASPIVQALVDLASAWPILDQNNLRGGTVLDLTLSAKLEDVVTTFESLLQPARRQSQAASQTESATEMAARGKASWRPLGFVCALFLLILGTTRACICDVSDYGARDDNKSISTHAIQTAIEACSRCPEGGHVLLRPLDKGIYLTGSLFLKSNIIFEVTAGVRLLGTANKSTVHWPQIYRRNAGVLELSRAALLNAGTCLTFHSTNQTGDQCAEWSRYSNITITGAGTIDGNGFSGWYLPPYLNGSFTNRPMLIAPMWVDGLYLSDLTLTDPAFWTVAPAFCKNVHIHDLRIITSGPNTDGVDPDSCQNVLVERCYISTGDDCIAIKSGRGPQALAINMPTANVTIRHVPQRVGRDYDATAIGSYALCRGQIRTDCTTGHGISIGSEMSGGIYDVLFDNLTLSGTTNGVRVKTCMGRGGSVRNVTYRNMVIDSVDTAVLINQDYNSVTCVGDALPNFSDILVQNVIANNVKMAFELECLQDNSCAGLRFENVTVTAFQNASKCAHVQPEIGPNVSPVPCTTA
ncbi:uncharacterized protein MONBRDRAFT_24852 [Monosiga brevicollis MX1]|uniref:Metallo-beta-lactamase domain-containing protein n=1 Tax=Monosiga brevicollis TaxID=81824 RepID=A9UXY0_MONBE|nr:uncharacterized protein MONBRDRAFT_24852 [Monosiga brevicollis MX1]EDQ89764.1 predicted protein [Monosiga brevicollis MX1]|eukprot:XP_001745186.1 hypothetical protein [Monosiga brevicollis MX1]